MRAFPDRLEPPGYAREAGGAPANNLAKFYLLCVRIGLKLVSTVLEFDEKDGDKEKYIAIAALFAFALKVVALPIEALKDSGQCALMEVPLERERFPPLQQL